MSKSLKQVLMLFVLINTAGLLAFDKTVFPGFGGRFSPDLFDCRPGSPVGNNPLITPEYLKHLAAQEAAKLAAKLASQVGTDLKKGS